MSYKTSIESISVEWNNKNLTNDMNEHKTNLDAMVLDFNEKLKESLNEHMQHRRTVFTNQQATFDNDIKQTRTEFKNFIAEMNATKDKVRKELDDLMVARRTVFAHQQSTFDSTI